MVYKDHDFDIQNCGLPLKPSITPTNSRIISISFLDLSRFILDPF